MLLVFFQLSETRAPSPSMEDRELFTVRYAAFVRHFCRVKALQNSYTHGFPALWVAMARRVIRATALLKGGEDQADVCPQLHYDPLTLRLGYLITVIHPVCPLLTAEPQWHQYRYTRCQ